jgi:hypothetical protein
MGLVMSRVMKGLAPEARSEVVKRLVPLMLFLMPALASVAITARGNVKFTVDRFRDQERTALMKKVSTDDA